MKFLVLPSFAQRKRKNGQPMPTRLFLADGTELKGISAFEAEVSYAATEIPDGRLESAHVAQPCNRVVDRLTIVFDLPRVQTVSRIPKRKRAP